LNEVWQFFQLGSLRQPVQPYFGKSTPEIASGDFGKYRVRPPEIPFCLRYNGADSIVRAFSKKL
jgi:hypothetical protein